MGKVDKGVTCRVSGCSGQAARSLSHDKVAGSGLPIEKGRRAYLCSKHYKEYKKRTKKDRQMEKMRFMG
jgi:hypothetical protein